MARLLLLLLLLCSAPVLAQVAARHYTSACASCHLPGIHGAPRVGDTAEWERRLRSGFNLLYRNTIEGVPNTAMLPLGGASLSEAELRAVVDYMIAASAPSATALAEAARYDRLGITDRDFIRQDRNHDGMLSRTELAHDPVLAQNLARFDVDGDDSLNEREYLQAEAVLTRERAAVKAEDAVIDAAVRKALSGVKGIDFQYAGAEVRDGTVILKGIVSHAVLALQAGDAVKRIAGIRRIENRLVSGDQMGWD
ncbi:MAG: c-type cytochrome [Burkholderiales bacterium]|nr:c-type cytochrome [Burkholderiales bacterium]